MQCAHKCVPFSLFSKFLVYSVLIFLCKINTVLYICTLPPSCAVVMKSGSLNFLEPSGPIQACNGTAFTLYMYRVGEKSPYTDQYATIISFESLTYALVTCPVNPYMHLDAGHTNGCASMSSVTYVGAFLE